MTLLRPTEQDFARGYDDDFWFTGAAAAPTSGVLARSFNGADHVRLAKGAVVGTGAVTFAAIVRKRTAPGDNPKVINLSSAASGGRGGMGFTIESGVDRLNMDGSTSAFATAFSVPQNEWVVVVATKAAGSDAGTFHYAKLSDSVWSHGVGWRAMTDLLDSDRIFIGNWHGITDFLTGDVATAAVWDRQLTQAQVISLLTNKKTSDFNGVAGGAPKALWDFNQADRLTSVRDLTNGGASQLGLNNTTVSTDGPAGWTYGLPVATLSDDFGDGSIDTAKWPDTSASGVSESGGRAVITTNAAGSRGYVSAQGYYLTDSAARVEVPTQPSTPTTSTNLEFRDPTNSNGYYFAYYGDNNLYLWERVAGVDSVKTAVPFSAVNHRWRRIRHSTAANLVYWEASPDGITWTVLRSKAPPVALGPYGVRLLSGFSGADAAPTVTEFDNFNVGPPVAQLTDDFNDNSISTAKWPDTSGAGVAESGGRAAITSSGAYPGYKSAQSYYLTDSALSVEVPTQPSTATLASYLNFDNDGPNVNGYLFEYDSNSSNMFMYERAAGVDSVTSVAYSATNHRWRRIRHSSATNLVYWETSPDGVTWTVQRSKTPAIPLGPYRVYMGAGFYGGTDTPTVTEFDNFNVAAPTGGAVTVPLAAGTGAATGSLALTAPTQVPLAAASGVASGTLAVGVSVGVLTDDFNDNTRDTAKWPTVSATGVAETGGRLAITSSTAYPALASSAVYYLTDSVLSVEVPTQPASPGLATFLQFTDLAGSNGYYLNYGSNGDLIMRERVGGVYSDTSIPFDATNHRWRRIRHSSATNLVYWESSPDGITWTTRRSKTPAIPLGPYHARLAAGFSGADTPTVSEFDNFNVAPVASTPVTVPLAATSAAASGSLAVTVPTQVPLSTTAAAASGSATLKVATQVPLSASSTVASGSANVRVATRVPLVATAAVATGTALVTVPTRVLLAATAATATGSATVLVPAGVPLDATAGVATGSLALTVPAQVQVPLSAAVGAGSAALALTAQTQVSLASGSVTATGSTVLTVPTAVPLAAAAGAASGSVAVRALTTVPLAASGATATATLVTTVRTTVPLAASPAAGSATLALTASTRVPLTASGAVATGTLTATVPTAVSLAAGSASATASVTVTAQTAVALNAASASASGTALLTRQEPVSLGAAGATATGSAAVTTTTGVPLGASAAAASGTVAVTTNATTVVPLVAASAAASGTAAVWVATRVPLAASAAAAVASLALTVPTRVALSATSGAATSSLALTVATRVPLSAAFAAASGTVAISRAEAVPLTAAAPAASATLALRVPAGVPLSAASGAASASVALVVATEVPLAAGSAAGSGSLAVTAPTAVALSAATAAATASFAVTVPTRIALATSASALGTLALTVPTRIALGAASGVATASLAVKVATATVALDAASGGGFATLAVTAATTVPLSASSGASSASLAVTSPTTVPFAASLASSAGSLALTAPTALGLGASSGVASGVLSLTVATRLELAAGFATASGAAKVAARTAVPLGAAGASVAATFTLTVPTKLALTASASASATLALTVGAAGVVLSVAQGVAAGTLALTATTGIPLAPADATATGTAALRAATFVALDPTGGLADAALALAAPARLTLTATATATADLLALTARTAATLSAANATADGTLALTTLTVQYLELTASASLSGTATVTVPAGMTLTIADATASTSATVRVPVAVVDLYAANATASGTIRVTWITLAKPLRADLVAHRATAQLAPHGATAKLAPHRATAPLS